MERLIDKSAVSKIWKLAWPVMLGQLLHSLMVTADMWFISRIGSQEAAAAGSATSLLGVIQVLPVIVAAGAIALVARYTGAKDDKMIKEIAFNGMILAIFSGIIVTLFSFYQTNFLMGIFGDADIKVMQLAKTYLSIAFWGLPFFFYNASTRAIVQATGDTKNPVKIFILANLINIALDYTFIILLGYGIGGAAAATVIAEITAFVLMSVLMFRNIYANQWSALVHSIVLNLNIAKRILKIGIFAVLQMITRPFTGLILFRIVLGINIESGAAFGIGGRMFNFVFIFLAGLGTAMSVMVGQSLGSKDIEGVDQLLKQGIVLAIINMMVFAVPFYLFPNELMRFFIDDPEVIAIGVQYLRITYTGVLFVVFSTVYGSAFSGAGDTFPPMMASLVGNWVVKIPLAYTLTTYTTISATGVWLAIAISVAVEAIILATWFKKGSWKEKVI